MSKGQKVIKNLAIVFAIFLIMSIIYNLMYGVSFLIKNENKDNNLFNLDVNMNKVINIDISSSNLIIKKGDLFKAETNNKYISVKQDSNRLYIKENNIHIMYSSNDGLLAITEYKLIKQNNKYSMLEVILHTGRKNQIRVHMNDIKHPVIGDTKYSNTVSPIKRMCLHAIEIKFVHPVNKNIINIKTNFPDVFNKMFD